MVVCCVSCWRPLAAALAVTMGTASAQAGEMPFGIPFFSALELPPDRAETSAGFDTTGSTWSAYSSAVVAPLGPLHTDGVRVKLLGSFSTYTYDSRRSYCGMSADEQREATGLNSYQLCYDVSDPSLTAQEREAIATSIEPLGLQLDGTDIYLSKTHKVTRYDAAVMPGYQMSWRGVTVKGYLGPAMESRTIVAADPQKALSGTYWGAKTALETWITLGNGFWVSSDASFFTGTTAYSAALRLGYKPLSWLDLGPELAAFGDEEDESARAGGFARLTIGNVETTVSGGFSTDYTGATGAYGAAGVYTKF